MSRLLGLFLFFILPASACLWDRDTLQEEAKGKLDTVRAIIGWFDRYPPRYYEMRLDRVTAELSASPRSLNLYDDAGVACSRLGRHDEAIAWMAKKKTQLDQLPDSGPADDRYRYLSNLGTFHLIRWITTEESARSANLGDLETSETLIAQALELNPGAHFGREQYQLMLIRWLLAEPDLILGRGGDANFLNIRGELRSPKGAESPSDFTFAEARKGITGLIQLGAAWESVDTFQALQMCLHGEKNASIAHLAYLRHAELSRMGSTSLHPSQDVSETIVPIVPGGLESPQAIDAFYRDARAAASKRDQEWIAYQAERFDQAMHPDTHLDFWNDWKEPSMPELPGPTLFQYVGNHPMIALVIVVVLSLFGFLFWNLGRRGLNRGLATS